MVSANFILTASGHVTSPQLNIMVFETDAEKAKESAEKIVASLYGRTYFSFYLYDVSTEGKHFQVASFSVEQPKPIVTVR